jgi:hypothetical protein
MVGRLVPQVSNDSGGCAIVASFGSNLQAASSQSRPSVNERVEVFSSAEETATLIETVSDGASLTPLAEIMGAGGVKWFMIKTPAGNVGGSRLAKIPRRAKSTVTFAPCRRNRRRSARRAIHRIASSRLLLRERRRFRSKWRGRHIIVAVTFNDSVTAIWCWIPVLAQTMISNGLPTIAALFYRCRN